MANDHLQFQICRSKDPKQPYYWRIWAKGNKKILAHSETMVNKDDCLEAIRLVKGHASTTSIFDMTGEKPELIE